MRSRTYIDIRAYASLVSCLPALQAVELRPLSPPREAGSYAPSPGVPGDLGGLLEALACCPRLEALVLGDYGGDQARWPSCDWAAFSNLRSLTKLSLALAPNQSPDTLPGIANALASLPGLAELDLWLGGQSAVVPAALGKLKALRSLRVTGLRSCVLEAGCFNLPSLLSLHFMLCTFPDTEVLPGATALQSLTRIEFECCRGPRWFDRQLVHLPRLAQILYDTREPPSGGACPWLSRLPADMGSLSMTLTHISCSGLGLTQFPLALTQLAALECLNAGVNDFAEVPAAITALSRLTSLQLGRTKPYSEEWEDLSHLYSKTLDARALGDLSAFPALRWLQVAHCEVALCESVQDAAWHPSLMVFCFWWAHPAPECTLTVLQLCQALTRQGRSTSLCLVGTRYRKDSPSSARPVVTTAPKLTPMDKFGVAVQACGM